jgi:uroporphyrinogen-III synthase
MLSLHGVAVLVTRPEQQARSLCDLLAARGAIPVRLPIIRIEPTDFNSVASRVGPIEDFDTVIFTSANAVKFGARLLGVRRDVTIAAVGPATARALEQAGQRAPIVPKDGFDSENLLLQPALSHAEGKRILIVKGTGGRELLEQQLKMRGARVTLAEVYERKRVEYTTAALESIESSFMAGEVRVITVTSAEIAAALLEVGSPVLRRELEQAQWVVPSVRVADSLRNSKVLAPILRASSAEDHDLVSAIESWRAGISNA